MPVVECGHKIFQRRQHIGSRLRATVLLEHLNLAGPAWNSADKAAFFQRGEDIGNIDVLTRLASDMALDGDDLREALDNHLHLENVLADEQEAKKLGLRGVPAFIANRKISLSGVQSLDSLQKFVEHARSLS